MKRSTVRIGLTIMPLLERVKGTWGVGIEGRKGPRPPWFLTHHTVHVCTTSIRFAKSSQLSPIIALIYHMKMHGRINTKYSPGQWAQILFARGYLEIF